MIVKTNGTVLRYWPYTNSSRIVSWFTPDYGRISTMIKGSQRPKSLFLGQYDLFYTCELVFYVRPETDLYFAKECYPLNNRNYLRHDYQATALASYYADLIYRFCPSGSVSARTYNFFNRHLDQLAMPPLRSTFLFWFELKLLEILGLAPRIRHCIHCNKNISPTNPPNFFSHTQGGILCANCAGLYKNDCELITPDVFATLTAWQQSGSFQSVRSTRLSPRQTGQIRTILGAFIQHQLDTPLTSRNAAFEILSYSFTGV